MSVWIGKYEFEGPYSCVSGLEEKPGLYVVLFSHGEEYDLIHVAEAQNIKERMELSQSAYKRSVGSIQLAAYYTPQSRPLERKMMLKEILSEFGDEGDHDCEDLAHRDAVLEEV